MASTEEILREVIVPLKGAGYRRPRDWDDQQVLESWGEDLSPYSVEDLRAGIKHLKQTRKDTRWPVLPEVTTAVSEAIATKRRTASPAAPKRTDEELEAFAMGSPLAHRAATEGWIGGLVDYVRDKDGQLPALDEQNVLRASGNRFRNEDIPRVRQNYGDDHPLVDLARTLLQRRVRYCERLGVMQGPDHSALAAMPLPHAKPSLQRT